MDERRFERTVSDAEVMCRIDGSRHRLPLFDLSTQGCRIDLPAGLWVTGRSIVVEFEPEVAILAEVVWQRGNAAGARFERSLPGPLVEKLAFKIAELPSEGSAPLEAASSAPVSGRSPPWP